MDLTDDTGTGMPAHVVQLYDGTADLTANVVDFLATGLRAGEAAIVIAAGDHRAAFLAALETAGVGVEGSIDTGRLIVLDAAETLDRFMVGDHPDPERFDAVVGDLVRSVRGRGLRLRAYGEMVAVLWEQGLVGAAIELEARWNDLLRREQLTLLCAYPTGLVAEGAAPVCDQHDVVVTSRTFDGHLHAPRDARRFVTWALESCRRDDAVDATELIVSELATNAVRHAASDFTVKLEIGEPAGVRLAVRDGDPSPPGPRVADELAESGRGLHLVTELASAWGTDIDAGGKVVWAEIGR